LINRVSSQTFKVKVKISTTDSIPVKYASVTFIDMSDTRKENLLSKEVTDNILRKQNKRELF